MELLTQVRTLLPENLDLSDLPQSLLERLAGTVSGLPTQALLQFQEPKRLGLLLCWLWRLRTQLIDAALTISNELVAGVLRRAFRWCAGAGESCEPNRDSGQAAS